MTRFEYHQQIKSLMVEAEKKGNLTEWMRMMCRNDIFFIAVYVLGRDGRAHV